MTGRHDHTRNVIEIYDLHPINEQQILEKIEMDGVNQEALTEEVLQNYDMDHYDGVDAIDVLAQKAKVTAGCRVLDVASGMGGPARYLAHHYGCQVTGIDLNESRVSGARRLTELVGLGHLVDFRVANALENALPDRSFDVVIGQEAWLHIPDKPRLVSENVRVAKPGGYLAFTDVLERSALRPADLGRLEEDLGLAEIGTPESYRDHLQENGCAVLEFEDLSAHWTVILHDRLAMYRSLGEQTIKQHGKEQYERWDATYAHFVSLFESGHLGGGRFFAQKR